MPLSAIAVQHIVNRVAADHGLNGVFNLLVGAAPSIGERMLNDQRVPLMSLHRLGHDGPPRGRDRRRAGWAARILELGGNNAIVVTEDADLALASRAILFAAVGTAGQRCTSTRRIIVHAVHRGRPDSAPQRAYAQVAIGNPLDDGVLMGPLVNEQAVADMFAALDRAQAEGGAGDLWRSAAWPDKGACFVEPTIVQMPHQTPLVCEETFAPILYLMEYDTLDEAIALHNGVPQGLSSAIFTTNLLSAETFLSAAGSDCGMANVNVGTSGAEIGLAFGGEKETGGGREIRL